MRAVVQRVTSASVEVAGDVVGAIGRGMVVLVGVTHGDDASTATKLATKLWNLRIFDDDDGVMNRSLAELSGLADQSGVSSADTAGVLVVSQFTLYGDTSKGRRPSWIAAARPDVAEPLVDEVVAQLRAVGALVETGRFRTEMAVRLVNDGPVTVIVDV
ncbi:MAG: D-aminoacyl-tRNA deacylase [Actinomycetota bacterium]|nr:D-aminoacyl-tRNA deacylase [Actinomycetota bacterium]